MPFSKDLPLADPDRFPREHALPVTVNGVPEPPIVCTPADLDELVIGHLYNAGRICSIQDVRSLQTAPEGAYVTLAADRALSGKDGRASAALPFREIGRHFPLNFILARQQEMDARAVLHRQTGGTHCSAIMDDTQILAVFEDISRRNTLDKLAGWRLLSGVDTADTLLLSTCRISRDILYTAARMGVAAVVSYSTPTREACLLADLLGITMLSRLTGARTICTWPERLEGERNQSS